MAARARSVSPPKKGPPPPLTLSSGAGKDHHHTLPLSPASQRELSPGVWPGSASGLRGRTMKEYDQQIADLEKENFNLKLKLYFLEEKIDHSFPGDTAELHKQNVQLEVEVEVLKKELQQKHRLLGDALTTLERLEHTHKQELAALRSKSAKERSALEKKLEGLRERLAGPLDAAVTQALLRATLAAREGDKAGIAAARAGLKSALARGLLDGETPEDESMQGYKDKLLEEFICLKEDLKKKDEILKTIQEEQASREAELKQLKEELRSRAEGSSVDLQKMGEEAHSEVSQLFQRIREQDAIIEDLQAKLLAASRRSDGSRSQSGRDHPAGVPWSEIESDRSKLAEISGSAQNLGRQLAKSVRDTLKTESQATSFKLQDCVDKLDNLMECLSKRGLREQFDNPQQNLRQNGFKILRSKTLLNNMNSSVDQSLDSLEASQFTIDSLNIKNEEGARPFEWPKAIPQQQNDDDSVEPDQRQMEKLKDLLLKARTEVHELQNQLQRGGDGEGGGGEQWKRRSLSDFGNSHSVAELREEVALLVLKLRQMSAEAARGATGNPRLALSQSLAGHLHAHLEELSAFLTSQLGANPRSTGAGKPAVAAGQSSDTDNLVLLLHSPRQAPPPWSSDSDVWSEPDRDVSLQRLGVPEGRPPHADEPYFEPPRGGHTTSTATENSPASRRTGPVPNRGPRTSKWRHKCETYLHSLVTLTRGLAIDLSHHRTLMARLPSAHPKELGGLIRKHGKTMEDLEDRLEEVIYNNRRVQELLKDKLYRGPESPENNSTPEEVTTKYGNLLDKLYACREEMLKKSEKVSLLEQTVAELRTSKAQAETELAITKKRVGDLENQLEMKDEELGILNNSKNHQTKAKEPCNCWQWSIQRKLKGSFHDVEDFRKKMEKREHSLESQRKSKDFFKQGVICNKLTGKVISDSHEMKQKEEWWKRKVEESEKKVETLKIGQERQMRANEHTISRLHFDLSAKDCEIAQLQKRVAQLKEELLKNISSVSQLEVERAERQAELNVLKAKLVEMEERCIWLQKELLAANTEKMESKETIEKLKDSIKEKMRLTESLEQNLSQEHLHSEQEIEKLKSERDHLKEEVVKLSKELEQVSSLHDASSLHSSSDICSISRSWTKSSMENLKGTEEYSKRLLVALTAEMRFLQNELGHRSHVNRRLRNKLRRYEESRQAGMSTSDGSLSMSDSASSARTSNSFAFSKEGHLPLRLALKNPLEDSDLWSLPTSQADSPAAVPAGPRGQFSPDLGIESDSAWLGSSPKSVDSSGSRYGKPRRVAGRQEDLDLLKRLLEDGLEEITATSSKVKDLLFSAASSAFKNRQYNMLMEVDHSCQNVRVWMEKGKNLIGCFWVSTSDDRIPDITESSEIHKEVSSLKEQLQMEKKKNTDLMNCLKITKKEKGEMEQAISWHLSKTCKMLTEAKENLLREKTTEE